MNLVAFGLILICCHAWAIEIDDNFLVGETYADTQKVNLKEILENFKNTLRNGDPNNGIPVLDPFAAESLPININEDLPLGKAIVNASLKNVMVTGLSSYQVNSASLKLVFGKNAKADMTWPSVFGSTNYVINGSALGYKVYGEGNMNATVKDFKFNINVNFKVKNVKYIQITSVTTTFSLGGLELHATGLFNDDEKSEKICKEISDKAPQLIKDNQKSLTDNVNYVIMKYGNQILSTINIWNIIG